MDINTLCDIGRDNPDDFNKAADEYIKDEIHNMCRGNEQCIWKANGILHRLNKESNKYIDPVARLNFVISRFWDFINQNY